MPALSPGKPVDRSARHRGPFAVLQARAHDAVERLFASRVPWILLFFLALIPLAVGPRLAPEPPALPDLAPVAVDPATMYTAFGAVGGR